PRVVGGGEAAGCGGVGGAGGTDAGRVPDAPAAGWRVVWVACGRGDPRRLVEDDVCECLLRERPPVELDAVARGDERVQLPGLAVDRDPAGLDQLVGAAT